MTNSEVKIQGFEAYFRRDGGERIAPESPEEWRTWVAASRARNWCLNDPLLDWLHLYGDLRGFRRDSAPDKDLDFRAFVFRQGRRFEAKVLDHLATLDTLLRLDGGPRAAWSAEACEQTFQAMKEGVPIISQGVLRNPEVLTYGAPDLLVRSDVLRRLFPQTISAIEAASGAPGLDADSWHYRVVDIKLTILRFDRHWHASTHHLAYMAQVFLYNQALARIQGYEPSYAYLLGRGWTKSAQEAECTNCMDRLAPVHSGHIVGGKAVATIAREAVEWIRRLRLEGGNWDLRLPCVPEIRPNPKQTENYPWHSAVTELAAELADPCIAWQVGIPGRARANANGIERWTDPRFTAAIAGVTGTRARVLDELLEMNRDPTGPAVQPATIRSEAAIWGRAAGVEFFVDFETVSNLNDDFTRIPEQNGQPLIAMIGCGHVEDGNWQFFCFTARDLSVSCEAEIIEAWLAHMDEVRLRLAPEVARPLLFHWSAAETAGFSGLKSVRARSPERQKQWLEPNWFDFLTRVIKAEPVLVRGPMGFGLKNVARSMRMHGLIRTDWPEGVADGLGAMVAIWSAADDARARGCSITESEVIERVKQYNEIDCKVMMEVIQYLRARAHLA